MENLIPTMTRLFDQLGLDSRPDAIRAFLHSHQAMPADLALHEAPFWTASQAEFLREQLQGDSDWSMVIDRVNTVLHEPPQTSG